MEMNYCMQCGTKLVIRHHETEGEVPYCESCGEFRYPVFNTAVSMIVMDEARERIILIQQYGKPSYVLVAGYVDKGEDAETAAAREVKEELGMTVSSIRFNRSHYYARSNTLMLNFTVTVKESEAHPNWEVDSWRWFTIAESRQNIRTHSLAEIFLNGFLCFAIPIVFSYRNLCNSSDAVFCSVYSVFEFLSPILDVLGVVSEFPIICVTHNVYSFNC